MRLHYCCLNHERAAGVWCVCACVSSSSRWIRRQAGSPRSILDSGHQHSSGGGAAGRLRRLPGGSVVMDRGKDMGPIPFFTGSSVSLKEKLTKSSFTRPSKYQQYSSALPGDLRTRWSKAMVDIYSSQDAASFSKLLAPFLRYIEPSARICFCVGIAKNPSLG